MDDADLEVAELWGPDASSLLYAAVACAEGDPPVDQAILRRAAEQSILAREIEKRRPRLRATLPGGAGRPRTSIYRGDGVLYVKGAVESVLPLCLGDTGEAPAIAARLASGGLRVIAVATGSSEREANLTLWGLIGLGPRRRPGATTG